MMKCIGKLLLFLFVLLFLNNGSVEAIYTMNDTCLYYLEGYIGHPDDCQSWGYCSGGVLKNTGKCREGHLYDKAKGVCNYEADVQCGATVVNVCDNVLQADFVAIPNDCNQYCYCYNRKIIECNSCPPDQRYDPILKTCHGDYICPIESVCRLVKDNAFVASPTTCGEFIRCFGGTGTSQNCANNNFFNPATGYCQQKNPCTSTNAPTDKSELKYPVNPSACSKYNVSAGGYQFMPDPFTCHGYYTCSSAYGEGKWRSCPFASQFNSITGQCVNPNSFSCTKNRCANVNIAFATVPFKSCLEYFICNNFEQSSNSYTCPSKYPYFDEVNQACVEKKPNYAICTSSSV